jgi:hypothetical protein
MECEGPYSTSCQSTRKPALHKILSTAFIHLRRLLVGVAFRRHQGSLVRDWHKRRAALRRHRGRAEQRCLPLRSGGCGHGSAVMFAFGMAVDVLGHPQSTMRVWLSSDGSWMARGVNVEV